MEWAELVGPLLEMAVRVVKYAGSVQRYRKKSKLLQGRVQLIEQYLSVLKKSEWVPDPAATQNTLESLCQILGRAEDLVLSCQRQRQVFDFLTSFQNKGEFEFVNQRISLAMESFHLANRTLMLIVLYSDRIFMDVLDTLVEDGACSRLPQAKKEALEKSTREWPYSYNMPPEKKRMLELIRSDLLRQGRSGRDEEAGASSTSASSCDQTQNDHGLMMQGRDEEEAGPSLSADDHNNQNGHGHMHELMQEVDDIVKEIIALEARMSSHNKEEIQRVAQLGQHVVGLLPHLQSHPPADAAPEDVGSGGRSPGRSRRRTPSHHAAQALRRSRDEAHQPFDNPSCKQDRAEVSKPHIHGPEPEHRQAIINFY